MILKFRTNDDLELARPLLTEKIGGGIPTIFACEKG